MDIGIGPVVKAHCFSYLPVPVGAGTITPAVPDTEYKPGCGRKENGKQVPFSCFTKSPAAHVEKGEGSVKDEEENIEEGEPHGDKDRVVVKFIYHSDTKGMKWGSPDYTDEHR